MAKRGEKRPWKVRYEWTTGIKGTIACGTESDAEIQAEKIRSAGEWRTDADVTVRVERVG